MKTGTPSRGTSGSFFSLQALLHASGMLREGLGRSVGAGNGETLRDINNDARVHLLIHLYLKKDSCATMEREEVIISNGNGLQSTKMLSDRIMAVCYIETVFRDVKTGKERLK